MEDLSILFEDEDILVLNKPSGLRVIPDGYNHSLPSIRSMLDSQFGIIFIVHRLDKDTSGVLLIARNPSSHRDLNTQFQEHRVVKEYRALVFCRSTFPSELTIDAPLRVNGDRHHRTVVNEKTGKTAVTKFHLLTHFDRTALVAALPKSGYTHQIRAHALYAGFPLLGDPLYSHPFCETADTLAIPSFPRTALHAFKITFIHPSSRNRMEFVCPLPADFAEFISRQNKTAEV